MDGYFNFAINNLYLCIAAYFDCGESGEKKLKKYLRFVTLYEICGK